jgi:hypothetical protein
MRWPSVSSPSIQSRKNEMKAVIKTLCAIGSLGCGISALAADKVLLETPVTYDPKAGVAQPVREQCHVEDLLATRVGAVLAKRNKSENATIAAGGDAAGATVLRLTITHVLGVGGGAWSGPKAITLRAELFEGKELKREQKVNRWSIGGFWGGFKSTCSILDRTATRLAKDLGRWSYDPRYKMAEDEAPPKDDGASAPQGQSGPAEDKE